MRLGRELTVLLGLVGVLSRLLGLLEALGRHRALDTLSGLLSGRLSLREALLLGLRPTHLLIASRLGHVRRILKLARLGLRLREALLLGLAELLLLRLLEAT